MEEFLKCDKYLDKDVRIFIPTKVFNKYGSVLISDAAFNKLVKHLLVRFGRCERSREVVYQMGELTCVIDDFTKRVWRHEQVGIAEEKKLVVLVNSKVEVDTSLFPICEKYTGIFKREKMIFTDGQVHVSLIKEQYLDDRDRCYPVVTFSNNIGIDLPTVFNIVEELRTLIAAECQVNTF